MGQQSRALPVSRACPIDSTYEPQTTNRCTGNELRTDVFQWETSHSNPSWGRKLRLVRFLLTTMFAGILAGCLHRHCACDRECVADQVAARMGEHPGPANSCATPIFPPGFEPGQPLDEDHAVLVALWANPGFQELLVDLRITRADLIQ